LEEQHGLVANQAKLAEDRADFEFLYAKHVSPLNELTAGNWPKAPYTATAMDGMVQRHNDLNKGRIPPPSVPAVWEMKWTTDYGEEGPTQYLNIITPGTRGKLEKVPDTDFIKGGYNKRSYC